MRGEKTDEGLYFKVYDIGKGFNLMEINKKITEKTSDYEYDIHYKFFKDNGGKNSDTVTPFKKKMYLTYHGLIKLLYCNRSQNAIKFQKWATRVLFSVQMGNIEDKVEIVAECMGASIKTVMEVFKKNVTTIPCVYLFFLGKVKDLRKTFNLDDKYDNEDTLYKYGMTNDISRRCKEHNKTYGKLNNVNLELSRYTYIDVLYTSKAENKISHYFDMANMKVDHNIYNELVVISKKDEKYIDELYNDVSLQYMGRNTELINKIKDLENEIKIKNAELNNKDTIILLKEQEIEHKDTIIKLKESENEIIKLKIQLNDLKN